MISWSRFQFLPPQMIRDLRLEVMRRRGLERSVELFAEVLHLIAQECDRSVGSIKCEGINLIDYLFCTDQWR